ncbi:MAG: hypothetical protein H8E66_32550 [Planctomycetes bacterium]|nr:hypothetical protein [Planctomycetota bacterium]
MFDLRLILRIAIVVFLLTPLANAAPNITNLSLRGFQIGGTTTVTIQGTELLPAPKLTVGIPVEKQSVVEGSTATNLTLDVTLANDVSPGLYNLRVASEKGISKSVIVAADSLPEAPLADRIEALPIALHGTLTGSAIAKTAFAGKAGQELLIEVEAQRLGGKLRPTLHLYDAQRKQVALAMPVPWLAGDARLAATLPSDGDYTIELHDSEYAGPAPGHFRLKVGKFHFADQTFPPAIQQGKKTKLQLVGNIPSDQQVELEGQFLDRPLAAPLSSIAAISGTQPRVIVSDLPELIEERTGDEPQALPSVPVSVSGRLDAAGQQDVYRVPAVAGSKLRIEVFADRLGSPIDPFLELRTAKGNASNDDVDSTTDPRLDYTVPAEVTSVDVLIRDQVDRGDQRSIYRLVITRLDDASKKPGFRLKVLNDTHNVRQGATHVLRVVAERDGYDGPIRLTFNNLPTNVSASGTGIAAGSSGTLVTLTAATGATAGIVTSIRGTSVGVTPPITTTAAFEPHPLSKHQPWMREELAFALAAPNTSAFKIDWGKPTSDTQLFLGNTFKVPVKLTRPEGAIGPIKLSFVSSEPAPLVNGKPDPNQSVRAAKAVVDIAVDPKSKAALDALAVAEKALVDTKAKEKVTREAGAKAVATADAAVKAAGDKQAVAAKAVADADARAKVAVAKLKVAMAEMAAAEGALTDTKTKLVAADSELAAVKKVLTETAAKSKVEIDAAAAAATEAEKKRVESEKALRDAEAAINKDVEFNVIVPPNLTVTSQDLVLKAELRSVDSKTVLAEVFTTVRRLTPQNPLALKLPGDPAFVAKLDAKTGATIKISGMIERLGGFGGDVTVTTTGQPNGVPAPKIVVKPDKSEFEVELKFPANFKAANIDTIKLVATGPPNPKAATIVVRTEIPLVISLLPAE